MMESAISEIEKLTQNIYYECPFKMSEKKFVYFQLLGLILFHDSHK